MGACSWVSIYKNDCNQLYPSFFPHDIWSIIIGVGIFAIIISIIIIFNDKLLEPG